MYNDIKILKDKIEIYYAKYGTMPIIKTRYTNVSNIKGININDNDEYYVIDLEAIDNLTLTYGKDYKAYKEQGNQSKEDLYIVNEKSHTIYYVKGIELDNNKYYTIPDEYTKIEIPEVNKITLQKLDKGVATIEINATNKNVGIKTINVYKGDTIYKTYEYTEQAKERKKETLDIAFEIPEENEWYIEVVDQKENVTQSNRITIKNEYFIKVSKPEDVSWDETQVDCYKDIDENVIPVPKGFTPIQIEEGQGTKSTGFVIRDTSSNKETRGNEFVWVPVEGMPYNYARYNFGKQYGTYSDFSETISSDEQTSVAKYGGYYIGRYESRNIKRKCENIRR